MMENCNNVTFKNGKLHRFLLSFGPKANHVRQTCCLFFSFLLIALNTSFAQEYKTPTGAPYIGLGAYSQQLNDVFAMQHNQAALGNQKNFAVGVFGERRFMLEDLSSYSLAIVLPTGSGSFGIQGSRFGFDGYNETEAGLGYGLSLGKKIAVGGRINYFSRQVAGYGNASVVNAEAGVILYLTPKLTAGAHTYNPVSSKFGENKDEKLFSLYRFGVGYDVSASVSLIAEVQKKESQPVSIVSAIHYQFQEKFFAKLGISSESANLFAAAGLSLNDQFRLDVFASHHRQLGFSPGLTIQYTFSKPKQ